MNNIKRVLSVVLCVLMMVSMMTVCQISFTFAATEDGYTYVITEDNTATVTGYTGTDTSLTVPAKLGGIIVAAIGDQAFLDNKTLSSVTLHEDIAVIGEKAFAGCSALTDITTLAQMRSIGDGAFMDCTSLESLKLDGTGAIELGIGMLSGCTALKTLTIPALHASLGVLFNATASADAGYPATLKTITVTKDETVEDYAFNGMTNVIKIDWKQEPVSIGAYAFGDCKSLSDLNCATTMVQTIGDGAFYNCKMLSDIELSSQVTAVGASAFEGCTNLASISVTDNLVKVGENAFKGTAWLNAQPAGAVMLAKVFITFKGNDKIITVPDTALSIADAALKGNANVKEVIIPENVTYIGADLLTDTKTEKVTIPFVGPALDATNGLAVSYLFGGNGSVDNAYVLPATFKEVVITASKLIPNQSFANTKYITAVTIPATVIAIGAGAFKNSTALETINYNAAVATIATDSFAGTAVKKVNFGEDVKTIPAYLCTSNDNLTAITIPAAVTKIESRAFAGCYNITTVNYNAVNCNAIASDIFDYCHKLNQVNLGENVKHIPANLYSRYGGSNIKELTIPEGITSIAEGAFSNCIALTTLNFNAADCHIGDDAFTGCNNLSKIVLGEKVTTIPSNLYAGNTAITKLDIPATVTRIDDYAFSGCSSLVEISIPDSLLNVGANITNGSKWYDLQADGPLYLGKVYIGYKGSLPADNTITITSGTLAIADGVFMGNSILKDVFIPNSVSYIGVDAFKQTTATITCYSNADYVIGYADQNGITCNKINCPQTVVYYEIVKEATATQKGIWNKICLDCSQILESGVEYAYGADADQWILTKVPTCAAAGVITKGAQTKPVAALGHQGSIWMETKAATCAADGEAAEFCVDCGTQLAGVKVLKKLEHTAGGWTVIRQPQTYCTGINAILCTECGEVLKSKPIDKLAQDDSAMMAFSDLSSSEWYYPTVQFVLNNNLMNGISETEFAPNSTMTRAMFVTVLGRMAGVEVNNSVKTKFTDVKKNQYYTGYVAWAVSNNIVNGVTDKTFCPNDPITREQICTMIVRYANYSGITLTAKKDAEMFRDADSISKYALNSVFVCQKAGIVKGRGNRYFAPKEKATRAEVAQILKNLAMGFMAE